uniref:Uncharacterized protein n=1 Tax=Streptomyces sp. NBC_01401 TaxID=2903854 RepID=A0AAU3GPR8_9ACTN
MPRTPIRGSTRHRQDETAAADDASAVARASAAGSRPEGTDPGSLLAAAAVTVNGTDHRGAVHADGVHRAPVP